MSVFPFGKTGSSFSSPCLVETQYNKPFFTMKCGERWGGVFSLHNTDLLPAVSESVILKLLTDQ